MIKLLIKSFGLVKDFSDSKEWLGKRWFLSKTLWANVIAYVGLLILPRYGIILSADEQLGILALMNMGFRLITKQPLVTREKNIIEVKPKPEAIEKKNDGDLPYSPKNND